MIARVCSAQVAFGSITFFLYSSMQIDSLPLQLGTHQRSIGPWMPFYKLYYKYIILGWQIGPFVSQLLPRKLALLPGRYTILITLWSASFEDQSGCWPPVSGFGVLWNPMEQLAEPSNSQSYVADWCPVSKGCPDPTEVWTGARL